MKITIDIPENYELKLVEKQQTNNKKFKRGDIIVDENCPSLICIYENSEPSKVEPGKLTVYYSCIVSLTNKTVKINYDYGIGYEDNCRLANEEEIDNFINVLKINYEHGDLDAGKILKDRFNYVVDYKTIRTYQDLINSNIHITGYAFNEYSHINYIVGKTNEVVTGKVAEACKCIGKSEKVAKSMLAIAQISQLMPFYGGEITEEEWADLNIIKYNIVKSGKHISLTHSSSAYSFLAFHTEEQRNEFLKYNAKLVKDYLMLD